MQVRAIEDLCTDAMVNIELVKEIVAGLEPSAADAAQKTLGVIQVQVDDIYDKILARERRLN
jgi:hypothetical protein